MAWRKPRAHWLAIHYPGSQEVEEYVYTPGLHGEELAKALIEGRILGMKCGGQLVVPPLTFCPDGTPGELVEVGSTWRIAAYTVVYEDLEGEPLREPEVWAVLRPDGFVGGLIHRVRASPESVYIGMPVRPVFGPREGRTGSITDILYFEPL